MKEYCTQNNGICETCSLVNYGKDCKNNPVKKGRQGKMTNKMLTKKCFLSQFPVEVDIGSIKDYLVSENRPELEMTYGVKIYRYLDQLIIEHDGKYFTNSKR